MKKLFLIAILSVFTFGFASNGKINDNEPKIEAQKIDENHLQTLVIKDCTVRLDFKLSYRTTIQGEITFLEVTWWQCIKMQVLAWWERNFKHLINMFSTHKAY